jgi:hypothetical protein
LPYILRRTTGGVAVTHGKGRPEVHGPPDVCRPPLVVYLGSSRALSIGDLGKRGAAAECEENGG